MFKEIANLASLMKHAQKMSDRMKELQKQLKTKRATGSAGAGMVEVEVNGLGEVLHVKIDPTLVEQGEREMIEDLLPAAVNQALAKAKQLHVETMQSLTGDLNFPGLNQAISEFMAGGGDGADEDSTDETNGK
jgi:nucleoid-associated protein EbfC